LARGKRKEPREGRKHKKPWKSTASPPSVLVEKGPGREGRRKVSRAFSRGGKKSKKREGRRTCISRKGKERSSVHYGEKKGKEDCQFCKGRQIIAGQRICCRRGGVALATGKNNAERHPSGGILGQKERLSRKRGGEVLPYFRQRGEKKNAPLIYGGKKPNADQAVQVGRADCLQQKGVTSILPKKKESISPTVGKNKGPSRVKEELVLRS